MAAAGAKTKIAILGGGMGALTAAFELTEQDPDRTLYDITVYQVGWRLGGKGAVGQDIDPSGRRSAKEHGLHVWAGFYDNAFDVLQRCYDALQTPPFGGWQDAFEPLDHCWVVEPGGRWRLSVPPNGLRPGIGETHAPQELWTDLLSLVAQTHRTSGVKDYAAPEELASIRARRGNLAGSLGHPDDAPSLDLAKTLADRVPVSSMHPGSIERDTMKQLLALSHEELKPDQIPSGARHAAILINLGIAILRGMVADEVLERGFDSIDGQEWSRWMAVNGAQPISLNSALVKGFYDYVFGYVGVERKVGAGTATRAFLRLVLTYKGSLFYTMRATMGELIVAPLYLVLKERGVKFAFFHRVDKLELSSDGTSLEAIDIGIQATPNGPDGYDPLIDLGDLKSWPFHPDYKQLKEGGELERRNIDLESAWTDWRDVGWRRLTRVTHFDIAILGIGLGALKEICADLARHHAAWRSMIANVRTTATMAMQLWLKKSAAEYGWEHAQTIVTAIDGCLTTWGDNSQLINQEAWPEGQKPASLAYFVGNFPDPAQVPPPSPDPSFPDQQLDAAKKMARQWRDATLPTLWRGFGNADLVVEPYVRVNINPSDRYVLSVPGSVESRLPPDGSGIDNLYLAGDWVRIGLSAGCVETAVMAGRAAAQAITGVDMAIPNGTDFTGGGDGSAIPDPALVALLNFLPNANRLTIAGSGTVEACCGIAYMPNERVRRMLPPGLDLARRPPGNPAETPAEMWPVAMVFARHSRVRPGFAPLGGMRYLEFFMMIPSVVHAKGERFEGAWPYYGPFCYMPNMLLDALTPVVVGVGAYGFKKRLARVRAVGDSFDIRSNEGQIVAQFQTESLPGTIHDFERLKTLRTVFEQPIISETTTGSWVYSFLDHHLDGAVFQSISGEMEMRGRQGEVWEVKFNGIRHRVEGRPPEAAQCHAAFRLTTNWDLTLPIVGGEYDGLAQRPQVRTFTSAVSSKLFGGLPGRRGRT